MYFHIMLLRLLLTISHTEGAGSEGVLTVTSGLFGRQPYSADQPELNGGVIQMVAYDVTDLLKAMGYADIENAFMFAWENWNWGTEFGKTYNNFDYNDMVYIMTNITPNATPEPATMLIFGLGLVGVAAARRMKRK